MEKNKHEVSDTTFNIYKYFGGAVTILKGVILPFKKMREKVIPDERSTRVLSKVDMSLTTVSFGLKGFYYYKKLKPNQLEAMFMVGISIVWFELVVFIIGITRKKLLKGFIKPMFYAIYGGYKIYDLLKGRQTTNVEKIYYTLSITSNFAQITEFFCIDEAIWGVSKKGYFFIHLTRGVIMIGEGTTFMFLDKPKGEEILLIPPP